MELAKTFAILNSGTTQRILLYWALFLLSLLPLCIVLPMAPVKIGLAIITAWIAFIWIVIAFARGQFHQLVLLWVAFYPYCYSLFSYPTERSVFTVDRAFMVLVLVEMFIVSQRPVAPLSREVRVSACFWALYLLVCLLSLANHAPSTVLPSYRLLVDGMVMPAIFGLYAFRYFPLLKDLNKLHLSVCILGLGLFICGFTELVTGIDLFPWTGSDPEFTETHVRRADGPFELHVVLSLVSILAFFVIVYLRKQIPQKLSSRRIFFHRAAAAASFTAAIIPLNRGLVFALVPIAAIDATSKDRLLPRRVWATVFGVISLAILSAKLLVPGLYEERVASPANFYQRVAQHVETLRVVREYPLFGVGFGLYHDVLSRNPRFIAQWKGIESMNVPHSVLMTVLSEDGVVGLTFYVAAQFCLILAMWRIREFNPLGWLTFVYCVLVYAVIGLDFGTVYFSDINLFYIFALGVIYQLQMRVLTEQRLQLQAMNAF